MRSTAVLGSCIALLVALAGCGGGQQEQTATTDASPEATIASPAPAVSDSPVGPSKYDAGPRAGESPVNAALAANGEKLFTSRICNTCHGFGRKITCPDLQGVSMRRTAQWLEHQIMEPHIMVREDPISWSLRKGFPLEMPNQNIPAAEARALIEYLKQQDKKAGGAS